MMNNTFDKSDRLRTVVLRPYLSGKGPSFTLRTYYLGGEYIGYTLSMSENGKSTVLFAARDFRPSPMHAIDSDDSVNALLGFLTAKPGDADPDYFEHYTPAQLAYCRDHAEALSLAALDRFGE
jgi:hypothetical protein